MPSGVHRSGGRVLVHTVAAPGGVGPARRRARTVPAIDVRFDPDLRIDTGAIVVTLEPGGCLRALGVRWRLVPWGGASAPWRVVHRCGARLDLERLAHSEDRRLELRALVTLHAGLSRIDVGLHVHAEAGAALPGGIGLLAERHESMAVRPGDGPVFEEAISLRRADGRWWRTDGEPDDEGPDPADEPPGVASATEDHVVLECSEPWSVAFSSGLMAITADPPARRVWMWSTEPGAELAAGEGRMLRARIGPGRRAPSPVAFGRPVAPTPVAGGGTPLTTPVSPMPSSSVGIEGAMSGPVASFLADAKYGLQQEGTGRGDWPFSPKHVGNLEYDTILGLLLHALRAGDARAFHAARAAGDHLLTVDRDAAHTGLFHPHGRGHRAAPIEAGHHWVEGLMLLDTWTADPLRSGILDEVLEDQARTLGALDLDRQLPRSLGWGLLALSAAAHREGAWTAATRTAVRRWRRHLLARQTPGGLLALVRVRSERDLHQENPFVQGGIIAPALARSLRPLPDPRTRRAARRLATALATHALHRVDDRWSLALRVVVNARSGRVIGRSGDAPGEHAALFLAGLLTTSPSLRVRPPLRALRGRIPATWRFPRKRYIGPELSILLRSMPVLADW